MTEFKLAPHAFKSSQVVEVWHDGEFVGQITAGDEPRASLRVISKHRIEASIAGVNGAASAIAVSGHPVNLLTVSIKGQRQ